MPSVSGSACPSRTAVLARLTYSASSTFGRFGELMGCDHPQRPGKKSIRKCIIRIERDSAAVETRGHLVRYRSLLRPQSPSAAKNEIIGFRDFSVGLRKCPLDFRHPDPGLDGADHTDRHLILKLEYVRQIALEPVSPEMRANGRIDKLTGDPHTRRPPCGRCLPEVAHPEFPADLPDVRRLALVGKARIAGDDEE